ncbi:MAG: extensin [Novosphingobium sp. 28-62-57]|uniref:extensin family protein n=1 Tax=unclassified Novosphingobium TaxID=2644732 RepID=UPI000BDD3436|nr:MULTISPECIES: extensin family protein [unclassified Novosphingobium]OYW47630.1 MAG: extensin [Novosphingobium sp. 12-63-9]OYZ08372.1 MAG: extensin [Novosphingobium sp. 28-62-57]OZA31315.1 MAG: extensin [Novosphingobium sp. 17-62-9]HQS68905.1 extensin family protein [Novosphingobium sp.]
MSRTMILAAALAALLSGCIGAPDQAPRKPARGTGATLSQTPQTRACLANLGSSEARFTPLADQYHGAGCSTLGTVRLAALRSDEGRLEITNLGPVTCPVATALQGWARFGVDRAARQILGSPLVRIETMGSYSCRNVAGTTRLSAHATANAIDIAAFRLADGRRISVLSDWNNSSPQVRAFLRTVRDSACKRFGTVLSPDYNAAHRDHFHLEPGGLKPFCR